MGETDLTVGSIPRHLLRLALPLMLSFILQSAYSLADLYFVGLLGGVPLAALSISLNSMMLIFATGQMVGVGALAVISQAYGAKDTDKVSQVYTQTLLTSLMGGAVLMVAGLLFSGAYFDLFTDSPEVKAQGIQFFQIFSFTFFIQVFNIANGNCYRAVGNILMPLIVMVSSILLNLVLDPLLIFGLGPFPALGIAGAAWATVISQLAAAAIYIFMLVRPKPGALLQLHFPLSLNTAIQKRILSIGGPASLQLLFDNMGSILLFAFIKPYGPEAAAALGVVTRLFFAVILLGVSVSVSVSAMVGQNYGAQEWERIKSVIRWGLLFNGVLLYGAYATMWLSPAFFIGLFTDDPAIISLGSKVLLINGMIFLTAFFGLTVTFVGRGLGRTVGPLITACFRMVVHGGALFGLSAMGWLTLDRIFWSGPLAAMVEHLAMGLVLWIIWQTLFQSKTTRTAKL